MSGRRSGREPRPGGSCWTSRTRPASPLPPPSSPARRLAVSDLHTRVHAQSLCPEELLQNSGRRSKVQSQLLTLSGRGHK